MDKEKLSAVTIDDRYTWYINKNLIIDQERGGPVDFSSLPNPASNPAQHALRLIYENIIAPKRAPSPPPQPKSVECENCSRCSSGTNPVHVQAPLTEPVAPRVPTVDARSSPVEPIEHKKLSVSEKNINLEEPLERVDSSPKRVRVDPPNAPNKEETLLGLHADRVGNNRQKVILSDGLVSYSDNASDLGNLVRFRKVGNKLYATTPAPSNNEFYRWKSELMHNLTVPDREPLGDYGNLRRLLSDKARAAANKSANISAHIISEFTLAGMSSNHLSLLLKCADGECRELRMFGAAHALLYKCFQRADFDETRTDQYKIELDGMFSFKNRANILHPCFQMGVIKFLETPRWKLLMEHKYKDVMDC